MTTDDLKTIATFRARYELTVADDVNAVPALVELWDTPKGALTCLVDPSGVVQQAFVPAGHEVLEELQGLVDEALSR